ncbi:TetR/AcrR family transcriptional regulator [Rhizobium sp. SSA_523]|uniref:TetR/AcrR family transcriptional regulator n=1 Tax=Rhizobium sp. SSA_523 TaxID=2952477 RepID=UPI0020911769|nr:TetR/AcrR family transcriptional regulator [Rhizobium sp. SSA_523]MCO5730571.1 TetR/AcrR family transcriptional regulator [Rhizobium sp. SSA_523]WKC25608.1 TetR/AcrR family transcriptional regulator [Rhizobium sp. SSA_523]
MTNDTARRPRTKSAEIRREELMDAAQALFLEKGFAATNVSEIVEGADVAKGTFYLYFKTKEDVLTALQIRFVESFCEKIDGAMAQHHDDWPSRLDAFVAVCLDAYLDSMPVHDLVFHQHRPANRAMKAGNPVITRLMALLKAGAKDAALEMGDPRLTAVMLFDALHGAVDDCLASGKPISRAELFQTVANFYRNALRMR